MRKQKRRMKIIVALELLFIFCAFSYLLGRNDGVRSVRSQVSKMENETIYLSESEDQVVSEIEADSFNAEAGDEDEGDKDEEDNVIEDKSFHDILLVNKDNCLPEDYSVTLKTLPDGVNQAAEEAYEPLCAMLKAGQKEGLSFEICSSYRDVKRQQELFDEDLKTLMRSGYSYEEAYNEVARETMPPGHSEHSTGLAFDIVSLGYQMLDAGQERTAENKWLQEHCAEYGFILRYPKDKEDITQISYESWHFRYVGVEVAQYIMENGITLEEYLGE